ncbi:hypothetical protein D3C83_195150 [compost metagenome]
MFSQLLVEIGMVGPQQIHNAPVVAQNLGKQHLGLDLHRRPQGFVELAKLV